MDAPPPPAAEPEPLPLPPPPAPLPLPADPPPADEPHPPLGFTLRRLCHLGVLFACLFLVVRYVFVEPFGVTTGSMAETIHGNRREKPCPQCGHPVCVGSRTKGDRTDPQDKAYCPNCGFGPLDLRTLDETFGDRLMVDKLVFRLRPPRRWEVAVFRCPSPQKRDEPITEFSPFEARLPVYEDRTPCENRTYVKRVVGLPGERIRLLDGDVYADGQLLRKGLAEVREVRIPVFQMAYQPRPNGWADRWEVGPAVAPGLPAVAPPKLPTVGEVVQDTALVLDATAAPLALTYRHRNPGAKAHGPLTDWVGYNGGGSAFADDRPPGNPVHDFMAECEVEVVSGAGGVFSVQLGDGADEVSVLLPIQAEAGSAVVARGGSHHPFDRPFALVPGRRYKLEFAFFDRRVLVAVDGKQAAAPFDLPQVGSNARQPREEVRGEPLSRWAGATRPVRLQCRGGHVVVRQFTLWRDIHYREGGGKHGVKSECPLGANEYFLLGDNTASSFDSREWDTPGVPEHDFLGKPFLVHQPLKAATVPVLGRVQAIDWERFRLLR